MFDFATVYRSYSTPDLLRIVEQPLLYQPAAVEAARHILNERDVSTEEYTAAAQMIEQEESIAKTPSPIDRVQHKVIGFLQYMLTPGDVFDPRKSVYWLSIALGVQVLVSLPYCIGYIQSLFCRDCPFPLLELLITTFWLVPPLTIILLLLGKRSGWMLAVFWAAYELFSSAFTIVTGWRFIEDSWLSHCIWLVVYAGMLRMLMHGSMLSLFQVSRRLWAQLFVAGIFGCLLTVIALEFVG